MLYDVPVVCFFLGLKFVSACKSNRFIFLCFFPCTADNMVSKLLAQTHKKASDIKKDLHLEANFWFDRYGCKPSQTHPLGIRLLHADLSEAITTRIAQLSVMKQSTVKKADRFMNAIAQNRSTKRQRLWAAQMKSRRSIAPTSFLGQCLTSLPTHGRPKAPVMAGASVAQIRANTAAVPQKIVDCGIALTPSNIVNWLYQATIDVQYELFRLLGEGHFDKNGQIRVQALPDSKCFECLGEVSLMWGSDLGSRRDQGMLAHDVDVDLAVFLKCGIDWAPIWNVLSTNLSWKGYRCSAASDTVHFRVGPHDPIEWHEWKELKNEIKAKHPGLSRAQINAKASPKFRQGKVAAKPHGTSFVDIEVYHVFPDKPIRIAGSKPFSVALNKLFPLSSGIFGPLKLQIPKSPFILAQEYGKNVMKKRVAKVITSGAARWVNIPDEVRRISWPVVRLANADQFLNI